MSSSSEPLRGWRVVVTRPRSQSSALEGLLTELGATVVLLPTIEIADPPSFEPLDAALRALAAGAYQWTVFLSANAARRVITRLEALSLPGSAMAQSQVAAVGRATADPLVAAGVKIDLVPGTSTAQGLAHAFGSGSGRVLIPRAADAPPEATNALRERGWIVEEVDAYRTVPTAPGEGIEIVRRREFDVVTFTSGSSVRGFAGMISPAEAGLTPSDAGPGKIACIGPVTARVAKQLGFRVDGIASEQTMKGLLEVVARLR